MNEWTAHVCVCVYIFSEWTLISGELAVTAGSSPAGAGAYSVVDNQVEGPSSPLPPAG